MVSLTATLFKAIINDASIAAATTEYIIDLAIGEINLHSGADLPTMGGTEGTKTVSLETSQYAAVMEAARAIYYAFFKRGPEQGTIGPLNIAKADLLSNPSVQDAIIKAARRLAEIEVDYG